MEGLVIGLDLNDDYSQISCNEKEKSWTVPTVICRRKEKETWLIGEEAYAATLLGEGVIVDKLLKMVRKEGTSTIGGICYTGTDLLKIFLKKLLDCPFKEFHTDQVEQLVITMHGTDAKVTDCLMYCADYLNIPRDRVHVISHTESFAYYVLSQRKELWSNQVGLFELSEDRLCYYEMKVQRGMRRNMVQAEAQTRKKPLTWISLTPLPEASWQIRSFVPVGKNFWKISCFQPYSLQEKALNVRTGQPVL